MRPICTGRGGSVMQQHVRPLPPVSHHAASPARFGCVRACSGGGARRRRRRRPANPPEGRAGRGDRGRRARALAYRSGTRHSGDPKRSARPRRPPRLRRGACGARGRQLRHGPPRYGQRPHRRRHLPRQPSPGHGGGRGGGGLCGVRRLLRHRDQGRVHPRRPGNPLDLAGEHDRPLRRHRGDHGGELPPAGGGGRGFPGGFGGRMVPY
jgi:hypothetical protein